MGTCKCGCGESVASRRVFVNKEHQLRWMTAGGATELNAMQPLEAKARGGVTSGKRALEDGTLSRASKKGADRAREIAREFREKMDKEE
ncbi:hypothetical protein NX905_21370 [Burkholderia thailandensis]|uniref:hypothetical protein n=1 Tax=Burkholderia thailandensis TaxID=57975 RepID=UPI00217D71A9|nr:hypothetical protein [Burkholderia thailandensis]MCS6496798.1 hypothetical protein [Burkholderia thailandensis]